MPKPKAFERGSLTVANISLRLLIVVVAFSSGNGHGLLTDPRQRGALRLDNHLVPTLDWNAPTDYASHFPSGSKSRIPGSGTASVRRAANNHWTPYEPLDTSFRWRAGVCGDEYGAVPQEHLRGGEYYYNGFRVREYTQGSIIFMESEIVTHHNGFFEFYICNIDACGDDISERCFHEGHCQKLMRTVGSCDSGDDMRCGPIDPIYPERWYLPCVTREPMMMGGWSRTIAYTLPRDLVCDHCVLQWYWVAANSCNVRGVHEYFTSPFAPKWGDCPGQGGAIGGWSANKPQCGGPLFPEEYWQCSDIRITPNPSLVVPPPRPQEPFMPPTSFLNQPSATAGGSFAVSGGSTSAQVGGSHSEAEIESFEDDHTSSDEVEQESFGSGVSTGGNGFEPSGSNGQDVSSESLDAADSAPNNPVQELQEEEADDENGNNSEDWDSQVSSDENTSNNGASDHETGPVDALGIHHSQV